MKEAPDKVYLHPDIGGREFIRPWLRRAANSESVAYIRKDALLEWKEELEEHVRKCAGGIVGQYEHGYWKALDDLIDKLNEM